jgi:uncharacterized protein YtpQ (UPF0354 family)
MLLRAYIGVMVGCWATVATFAGMEMTVRADDLASGAFKGEVLALIKRERPTLAATDTGKSASISVDSWELGLDNLFRNVRDLSGGEREAVILGFVDRAIVPSEPEFTTLASAAPKLRVQIVPSEFAERQTGAAKLVSRPLSQYVAIAYAIDESDRMSYLTEDQLARWKADVADVNALAVANLDNMSADTPINVQGAEGEGRFWVHYFDDGYGVARILCSEFVARLRIALGEKFFVGLPNREILIAWSLDWNQKAQFAAQIRSDFGSEPHPRSPEIFAIDAGGLRLATTEELRAHGR